MDVNNGGIGKVRYPLIADLDKSISRAYDVLMGSQSATVLMDDEEIETSVGGKVAIRGSFLIDEEGVIRHAILNDLTDFAEPKEENTKKTTKKATKKAKTA